MRKSSTVAVGLLLSIALPGIAMAAADPGEQLMLERAKYWRAQHRPDVVGNILNKLLSLNPRQPDALYQQGLLALEQGRRDEAQRYFDRLRQLVPSDQHAAELFVTLMKPAATAANGPKGDAPVVAPMNAQFAAASADSDDLLPPSKSSPPPPLPRAPTSPPADGLVATLGETALRRQLASLPQITISDGNTTGLGPDLTSAPESAGSLDLGIKAKAVQVSQVELEPPSPINGYQPLATTPYSPTDTLEMDIERDLTQLESQTNPMLIAGVGFRAHSGDPGLNRLDEIGVPIQGSFSPWYTGTATIAVIPVYLDAGGSVGKGDLPIYGTNPLVAAAGGTTLSGGSPSAGGVGLLGSYSWQDFSGQFGTTPLGFPVTNLIGDVAYQPKFLNDTLSVRFEGLRQPVTDSVLSYAGTHANLTAANAVSPGAFGTNPTWGGVVKTGAHVAAFYDDQMYGGFGGVGVAWLTGTNVAQNSMLDAQAGAYFRPWKTDNWAIRVGISGYYASYDKNLSGFTFGQGGYFSPQDYEALTFPVEYTGHEGRWSWLAAVAAGVQHFDANGGLVFPNNPGAQVALETLSPATASYSGTHTFGPAINLKGQIEYAVDPTLTLGAAASFDNGNNWNEGIAKVYLRKTFDWFAPVAAKNDPVSIAARDNPASRL
jgi:hypothetical protein